MVRGKALGELIRSVPFVERDGFVDELLGIEPPPPDEELPRGAVPYVPCGVDEILAAAEAISAGETIAVLGSGLGRVAVLLHLLTGCAVHGIEIQRGLVERAVAMATRLELPVTFQCANLVDVELDASIVFLYAPCNGAMLAQVIARIRALASTRPITVMAVGLELEERWLVPRRSSVALAIYDGRA